MLQLTPAGEVITRRLKELGRSQSWLARRIKTQAQHVYLILYVTAQPSIRTIYTIAEALGMDPHEICDAVAKGVMGGETDE